MSRVQNNISAKSIMVIVLIIAVLTILFYFGSQQRESQIDQYVLIHQKMETVVLLHSVQNEVLLQSYSSFSKHYDFLTKYSHQLNFAINDIEHNTKIKTELPLLLKRLKEQANDRQQQIERFKSSNAILQNSIQYLPTLFTRVLKMGLKRQDSNTILHLLNTVQSFYINPTDQEHQYANQIAKSLSTLNLLTGSSSLVGEIKLHSTLILKRKSKIYQLVKHYLEVPIQLNITAIMDELVRRTDQIRWELLVLQRILYALLVLLMLLVAYYIISLNRARVLAITNANLISNQQIELKSKEKLASIGEMASHVAHEINNPLSVIYLNLRAVKNQFASEKADIGKCSSKVEKIEDMSKRIGKIAKDLLAFSRDAARDPIEKVTVKQLVDDTLSICHEKFVNQGVNLTVGDYSTDLTIECRAIQISQILLNLFTNAYDAIEDLPTRWIRLEVEDEQEVIKFVVTDCGSGIPDEVAQKIFNPFFTTKVHGRGTGLGLSIINGIVEKHRGKFELDSKCQNTRFIVTIPKRHLATDEEQIDSKKMPS
ncbi:MAG: GHKL domain-containing protein [Bdellovibrionales bacterium]|jgi:signal transduction histidine kinase|nr:GHKL domain-containing protein [Bdellovibrionales bacterium]MBT3526446.1 GHKL domain-containing protein [Bdellovibrionales bacterium]MBT7668738.1 GHKL domain-containing protein [Bdellovibrionales bacterium]MBT7766230.1 GHKL domain-containing protein [Bdellovibrionales bacterium]